MTETLQSSHQSESSPWDDLGTIPQQLEPQAQPTFSPEKYTGCIDKLRQMNIKDLTPDDLDFIKSLSKELLADHFSNKYTTPRLQILSQSITFFKSEDFSTAVQSARKEGLDYKPETANDIVTGLYSPDYMNNDGKPKVFVNITPSEACKTAEDVFATTLHESLHFLSNEKLDSQYITDTKYSAFTDHDAIEEGITEFLAQKALSSIGGTVDRKGYSEDVNFINQISECVGYETIKTAYLPPDGRRFGSRTIAKKFDSLFSPTENSKAQGKSMFKTLYANYELANLANAGVFGTSDNARNLYETAELNMSNIFFAALKRA